jgi:hypothetical protein
MVVAVDTQYTWLLLFAKLHGLFAVVKLPVEATGVLSFTLVTS